MNIQNFFNIDIFCKVVDNFGDIGVCYRLANNLSNKNCKVRLFVDDLLSFQKILKIINPQKKNQNIENDITVIQWENNFDDSITPSEVVIEGFACNLPQNFIEKFNEKTLWINLEYLSAENWIEDCHKMQSLQPNNIRKYFFFPGFTNKTGGLNFEENLLHLNKKQAREKVFKLLNIPEKFLDKFIVFIFTYENENLIPILKYFNETYDDVLFLIPEGRSYNYLTQNFDLASNKNYITFKMQDQKDFDYILRASNFNIVRGEDSIVQAIFSDAPFLWHIYKQEENAHIEKLEAFLDIYTQQLPQDLKEIIEKTFINFNLDNKDNNYYSFFKQFMIKYEQICKHSIEFATTESINRSLSSNLIAFIKQNLN